MGCAGALDIVLKGRRSLVRNDMEKRVERRITRRTVIDFRMAKFFVEGFGGEEIG
jgi:hypothetical protein